jgi:hypothetical protein
MIKARAFMSTVVRGFRQFDAPVCVIVTYDRVLDGSDDTPFDCGAVATALVNAAWSRGLGWPDETFPANAVISERKSVAEASAFVGFDD